MKNWLSIGEFSKATGLTAKALRMYEELGLLDPHARRESRYRVYTREQISIAKNIIFYKKMGFSLEQIKLLLRETDKQSLQSLLETRLFESRKSLYFTVLQIERLENILTSLKSGKDLSADERSHVMDNIAEVSVQKLKRKGITDCYSNQVVQQEIALYSEEKKNFINKFRHLLDYAKRHDILLGPGRGSSVGSLVLFAEGYSPYNPLSYGLLPELFGESKFIWLDVEYFRYEEIGRMCDEISKTTGIEVVAFRSPILDIFRKMESKIGRIDFDAFSDNDPLILGAAKNGTRGLFWLEWNPNFHAFENSSEQNKKENNWDNKFLEEFHSKNIFKSPMDYIIQDALFSMNDKQNFLRLHEERSLVDLEVLPELEYTKGLLVFREDWVSLYSKHAGVTIVEASVIQRSLRNATDSEKLSMHLSLVKDEKVRKILADRADKVFSKAHSMTSWWMYKRTAILKSLWPKEYMETLDEWENENNLVWFEFGYKTPEGEFFLKA